MDPDATIDAIRDRIGVLLDSRNAHLFEDNEPATALAELVKALDDWITGGGFLPRVWQREI